MSKRLIFQNSIRRQVTARMLFVFCLVLVGSVIVAATALYSLTSYELKTQKISQKKDLVESIQHHANEIILRGRGYYLLLNDYEYDNLFSEKNLLEVDLIAFQKVADTPKEMEWIQSIEKFSLNYFDIIFPNAVNFAKQGDVLSMRKVTAMGENSPVNVIMREADLFSNEMRSEAKQQSKRLFHVFITLGIISVIYVAAILIVSLLVGRRLANEIGSPLERLSAQTNQYRYGEMFEIEVPERDDEIRYLSKSFAALMLRIQHNEEELTAQNEELQAQQIELQAHQLELTSALLSIENQRKLTQSILNTVHEGIHVTTAEGEFTFINENMKRLVGLQVDHWLVSVHDLYDQFDSKVSEAQQLKQFYTEAQQLKDGESKQYIYELLNPEKIIVQVYALQLNRGEGTEGTVFVHRDITHEREMDEMKTELVSTVSHELRTPLSSVLGLAELMINRNLEPATSAKVYENDS